MYSMHPQRHHLHAPSSINAIEPTYLDCFVELLFQNGECVGVGRDFDFVRPREMCVETYQTLRKW